MFACEHFELDPDILCVGNGYIAAEIKDARGVLLIDDTDFSVTPFDAIGARNPAWAPADAETLVACE